VGGVGLVAVRELFIYISLCMQLIMQYLLYQYLLMLYLHFSFSFLFFSFPLKRIRLYICCIFKI
jgi:hypothetical protein